MYKYSEITRVEFELTSNCQAACPMCARNIHGGKNNPNLPISDIDLNFFKKLAPADFLQQLKNISLCGNFGDPLLNKELLEICEYISESNPNVRVDLHTNASMRSKDWWSRLAIVLPKDHVVHFGIDGLEDTHSLYRINTSFNKIIENAKAFISAGGTARWNYITFKHNEHQMEQARQLAKDLGFASFHEKQTSRFIGNPWFDVWDKDGNTLYKLENPSEQKIVFIEKSAVDNYRQLVTESVISCEVESTKSVFVDAQGYLWPCCFVGGAPYHYTDPKFLVHDYRTYNLDMVNKALDHFGGMEGINLRTHSIKDIVDSIEWQNVWDASFTVDKIPVCARTCGKFNQPVISQCRDQFLELDEFDE